MEGFKFKARKKFQADWIFDEISWERPSLDERARRDERESNSREAKKF